MDELADFVTARTREIRERSRLGRLLWRRRELACLRELDRYHEATDAGGSRRTRMIVENAVGGSLAAVVLWFSDHPDFRSVWMPAHLF